MKKSDEYKEWTSKNIYNKGKVRKFTYTTVVNESTNAEQSDNLLLLYRGNNGTDNTIWTDKTQFN